MPNKGRRPMYEGMVQLTDSNFDSEISQSAIPILVDFWAVWCGPCKMRAPELEKLYEEKKNVLRIGKLNVDDNRDIAIRYGIRSIHTFLNLSKKVKEGFVFSVKANSVFTHQREYSSNDLKTFLQSLKPISDCGKLASILFQFPWSFKAVKNNFDYLKRIGEDFKGFDSCVELRNNRWMRDNKAVDLLSSMNMGFCNVDEPQIEGLL